jgi:hypothetical protein
MLIPNRTKHQVALIWCPDSSEVYKKVGNRTARAIETLQVIFQRPC